MREVKMKALGCFLLVLLAMPGFVGAMSLASQLNNPPEPLSVEAEGMGEAVVADGTLFNATAFNPALLSNAPYSGEFSLGFDASSGVTGLSNYLSSGSTDLPPDTVNIGAGFNLALKFDDHWGFQVYNNSHGFFQLKLPGTVETITGPDYLDTVALATYNFKPLEDETPLTVGVNLKIVDHRVGTIDSSETPGNFSNFNSEFHPSTLRWGLDLGLLYEFQQEHAALGLSALDLFHSAGTIDDTVGDPLYGVNMDPAPVVVKCGASWNPIGPFVLNADVDDLFSDTAFYSQNPGLGSHVKLGAALNLFLIQLKGGLSNGNVSLGFRIPFLGLDCAYAVDNLNAVDNTNQVYSFFFDFKVEK